ncbi:MAG: PepSY-associated TM helix domain-containing protein, partial [Vicinamibacterales bacterium]
MRKVLFWIHLVCGVAASVVILIMSVTGVLLTYQRQMTAWADMRTYRADPPAGATRLPVEVMVAQAAAQRTGDAPMTVTLRSDPRAPASVALGPRTLFVNPYTGDVLGEGALGVRAFFRSVTDWHRW